MRSRHPKLLEVGRVRAWYDEVALGSRLTADNYLRMLGKFLEEIELTPTRFLRLPGQKQADLLRAYVGRNRDHLGARPGSSVVKKAVLSWLRFNNRPTGYVENVSVKGAHIARTAQRLPTKDDLRRVLNIADAKTRVALALIAFAGQRPEVIGNKRGDDGLRFSDLPETQFDGKGQLVFDRIPALINVRPELSKTKRPYFTFLGPEGCEYLKAYVADRVARGQKVTRDSAVFALEPKQQRLYRKEHMTTANICDRIRAAMNAAGLTQRPYIWRSYFSQNAAKAVAESLPVEWREFWEGHSQGVHAIYALRDPHQLAPEMREAFDKKVRKYIETTTLETSTVVKEAIEMLMGAGANPNDSKGIESPEELAEFIKTKFTAVVRSPVVPPQPIQKIIPESDLEAALAEGWNFRAMLPSGRVIVEKAS